MSLVKNYRFLRLLGKGGFAEVNEYVSCGVFCRCRRGQRVVSPWHTQEDTTTGKTVAIKQIFEGDKRAGVNLGAIKEMQVLLEIQHPNVIRVRGLDAAAGT